MISSRGKDIIKLPLSSHTAGALCAVPQLSNKSQVRNSFYNKYRHGPLKISNPSPDYVQWLKKAFSKEGIKMVALDIKRIFWDEYWKAVEERTFKVEELCYIEHFDSIDSIKKWKPVADSDSLNGYSVSNLSMSKAGHALFHGVLDNRVPDDGVSQKSGSVSIIGPRRLRKRLFSFDGQWEWYQFNSIEIRFRGDGRKYSLIVNTADSNNDLTYYDFHGYPLYTRGGPHWQTVRVPLSKFIFANKVMVQDVQGPFPLYSPNFVAITLQDCYDGPFSLEIDYIALLKAKLPFEEDSAYEGYRFKHMKWIDVKPGCDPPEHHV